MSDSPRLPALSVVLLTPDRLATLRKTLAHLEAQSAPDRIEVVVVGPRGLGAAPPDARPGGPSVRIVELDRLDDPARARVVGLRAATAPVVAFGEEHAFPEPGWAAALIEALRGPYAAAGPVVTNANPVNAVSWADLVIGYGPWMEPDGPGEAEHLPGHNSAYRREVLDGYGDERLTELFSAETVLHWELRDRGHRLRLLPAARLAHTNFAEAGPWIAALWHGGRAFAAGRRGGWPLWRRWLYALGSPLIPLVRGWRLRRAIGRARSDGAPWHLPIVLGVGLAVDAVAQGLGYLSGGGGSTARLADLEFHRERYARLDRLEPEEAPDRSRPSARSDRPKSLREPGTDRVGRAR